MTEINITTTDDALIDDLNAAGIDGVRATKCRPGMAFDTKEHISQLVVSVLSEAAALLLGKWLKARLERTPPPRQPTTIIVNNNTTINAENVIMVIQQAAERSRDQKGGKTPGS